MLKFCSGLAPVRYIRAHPFSTMALCNIVGDLGYLGYAFAAEGFVSLPKLIGALCTMFAHVILLAYGDDQMRLIIAERGRLSRIVFGLRGYARKITNLLPHVLHKKIRAKPVGIAFGILMVNGVGLLSDAVLSFYRWPDEAMAVQALLGSCIILGTLAFAFADFCKGQKMADILTKLAPGFFTLATVASAILAFMTLNIFLIMLIVAFTLSNFAGFYTHIDKEKGQHLHS